ncbi:MAG TPA: hypothetical protein VGE12_07080 [Noviherbaspirillum sp.]
MRITAISLTLLLSTGASAAIAEPGGGARGPKDVVRTYFIQNVYMDRDNTRQQQQSQQALEQQRRQRDAGQAESSGFGAPGESHANSSAENSRKQGRLSPEERRTLRRQIDEVGHDIYTPRR